MESSGPRTSDGYATRRFTRRELRRLSHRIENLDEVVNAIGKHLPTDLAKIVSQYRVTIVLGYAPAFRRSNNLTNDEVFKLVFFIGVCIVCIFLSVTVFVYI